jgi:hypothetical protein
MESYKMSVNKIPKPREQRGLKLHSTVVPYLRKKIGHIAEL